MMSDSNGGTFEGPITGDRARLSHELTLEQPDDPNDLFGEELFGNDSGSEPPSFDPIKSKESTEKESTDNAYSESNPSEVKEESISVKSETNVPESSHMESHEAETIKREQSNGSLQIQEQLAALTQQTHTIVIPSYAKWFKSGAVNEIEEKSLPEFFNGFHRNKTPQMYVKYRDFMLNTYRLNPNEYLSVTVCRRNLAGDAATVMRVHRFLTKWGLINYQVDAESRPNYIGPPTTADYQVDYDTPRGLFPFESYKPPLELPDMKEFKRSEVNDETRQLKRPKLAMADPGKGWTEDEVEKLLSGIEKFKSDWTKVAKHVGSHTPEQCIIRFLQLPIEDEFLEQNPEATGPLKYLRLPFNSHENPVMSTLAFLTSLVEPEVAAAASNRAIRMADENLTRRLNSQKGEVSNSEDDPLRDAKDAAYNSFGVMGARSHVLATYQERQMHNHLVDIVDKQLKIIDLKLSKFNKMEKDFELQRKNISKGQQELLLDRLSLAKATNEITDKLTKAAGCLDQNSSKAGELIQDAMKLIHKPPRRSLNIINLPLGDGSGNSPHQGENDTEMTTTEEGKNNEEFAKPVSLEVPQSYKFWSG